MSRRGNVLGLVRGRAGQVSASPAKENLADITSRVIAERYEAAGLHVTMDCQLRLVLDLHVWCGAGKLTLQV